jgi:hypothetical protein
MSKIKNLQQSFALILLFCFAASAAPRWTEKQANDWYAKQPFQVGANYIPATAINELEMWQADTFDPQRIDLELGWAESLGMNTMRVFLHDLAHSQDPEGFKKRLDQFLDISAKHKIKPMIVLFDSVWDPNPVVGKQRVPRPGIHNSGWLQSPGAKALRIRRNIRALKNTSKMSSAVLRATNGIHSWDIWNEPDNRNGNDYAKQDPPNKIELVNKLLPLAFGWARAAGPQQPLTSGVWKGDYPNAEKFDATEQIQIDNSDFITFHSYEAADEFAKRIKFLQKLNRPIMCTEYMARPARLDVCRYLAGRGKIQCRNDQLGFCRRQIADELPVGFVGKTVCRIRAVDLVSRYLPHRRHALPARRN